MEEIQKNEVAKPMPNPRPDIAYVIGIKDCVTVLAERLCYEFGLRVHRAMKLENPGVPMDSLKDDAVIVPELGKVDTVLVCGLKVSEKLTDDVSDGPIDCNWTDNAQVFAFPLVSILAVAKEGNIQLPIGWTLKDIPERPDVFHRRDDRWIRQWHESECSGQPVGHFGPSGTVVADFGNGKQLLQMPPEYSAIFPLMENRRHL